MSEWQVRLFQRDAIEFCKKLPDNSIDLFIFDPPYGGNPALYGTYSKKTVVNSSEREYNFRDLTPFLLISNKDFYTYMAELLDIMSRKIKDTGNIIFVLIFQSMCYLWNKIPSNLVFVNVIYWLNARGGYQTPTAYSLLVRQGKAKVFNAVYPWIVLCKNKKLHYENALMVNKYLIQETAGGEERKTTHNLWIPKPSKRNKYYTAKPLNLYLAFIETFSPEGGIVCDCFCGSGVAGEASIILNRKALLNDIGDDAIDTTKVNLLRYLGKEVKVE